MTTPRSIRLGAEVVGEAEQVLGGVDDVVRDAERAADDVRRATRQHRHRDARAREAVGDLVEGAVAAERNDDVVLADARLAADLDRVRPCLGADGGDVVAALERVDDEGS